MTCLAQKVDRRILAEEQRKLAALEGLNEARISSERTRPGRGLFKDVSRQLILQLICVPFFSQEIIFPLTLVRICKHMPGRVHVVSPKVEVKPVGTYGTKN